MLWLLRRHNFNYNICPIVFFNLAHYTSYDYVSLKGGVPRVVVSTAAFHASVRGSFPGLCSLKETHMFLPHPLVKLSIVGSLRDRDVRCSVARPCGQLRIRSLAAKNRFCQMKTSPWGVLVFESSEVIGLTLTAQGSTVMSVEEDFQSGLTTT